MGPSAQTLQRQPVLFIYTFLFYLIWIGRTEIS